MKNTKLILFVTTLAISSSLFLGCNQKPADTSPTSTIAPTQEALPTEEIVQKTSTLEPVNANEIAIGDMISIPFLEEGLATEYTILGTLENTADFEFENEAMKTEPVYLAVSVPSTPQEQPYFQIITEQYVESVIGKAVKANQEQATPILENPKRLIPTGSVVKNDLTGEDFIVTGYIKKYTTDPAQYGESIYLYECAVIDAAAKYDANNNDISLRYFSSAVPFTIQSLGFESEATKQLSVKRLEALNQAREKEMRVGSLFMTDADEGGYYNLITEITQTGDQKQIRYIPLYHTNEKSSVLSTMEAPEVKTMSVSDSYMPIISMSSLNDQAPIGRKSTEEPLALQSIVSSQGKKYMIVGYTQADSSTYMAAPIEGDIIDINQLTTLDESAIEELYFTGISTQNEQTTADTIEREYIAALS